MNFYHLLSLPYQIIHELHKYLYKYKIFKKKKLNKPVISIGNFTFGGTGKTPVCISLCKYLKSQGLKVAILSRGYGRINKGTKIFTSKDEINFEDCGDEIYEMHQASKDLDWIFGVSANRYETALEILKKYPVDIFILDDGLQHLALERDIDIVLINPNQQGFLREFPHTKDCDFVLYTKINQAWSKKNPEKYCVEFNLSLNKKLDHNKAIGIFTGIANAKNFCNMVENMLQVSYPELKQRPILRMLFPDHYIFSLGDVTKVLSLGINVLTTRKDLARIPKISQEKFTVVDLSLSYCGPNFLSSLFEKIKNLK